jgi:superfamily II DNA or RNA helicase
LITLRDYQEEAEKDVWSLWMRGYRAVLLHFATGLGKTVVMGAICRKARAQHERCLVIAHLRELLDGASETFKVFDPHSRHYFERGVEFVPTADIRREKTDVVFAMVQSIHRRLKKYPRNYFHKIFIDETHRSAAKTYRKIIDHFSDAQIVGVTATPKRADKIALGTIFDAASDCQMSVTQGIALGWLTPFRPVSYNVKSLDYSDLDLTGSKDFTSEQIERALQRNGCKPLYEIAAGLQDFAKHKQSIVFVAGIGPAQVLSRILREDYNESVDFIYGGTDYDSRKSILDGYRNGRIKRIVNVGVLTEGVDLPNTQCVAIARITRSEGRYLQMAGRGTRPFPGGIVDGYDNAYDRCNAIAASVKPDCLLLDFKGNMGRVDLAIDGMELLAGIMPHADYYGMPRAPEDAVVSVGRREENNGKTIDEIRQIASDELLLDEILSKNRLRVRANVKEAEWQEYRNLFGLPTLPDKPEKKVEYLPVEVRADPETRAKIISLRERVGMPPPTTEYLLTLAKDKARKVLADLVKRATDPEGWLAAKLKKGGKREHSRGEDHGVVQAAGNGAVHDNGRPVVQADASP